METLCGVVGYLSAISDYSNLTLIKIMSHALHFATT